ncbi:uncharacterized protein VNE69_02141 [Vairimorpha necatrix]|uniref:Uncharacterized protein n=1 Tax=Vairimorpha necatrix TaxID=6039 RepID=A0AAX4J9R8_9MICR
MFLFITSLNCSGHVFDTIETNKECIFHVENEKSFCKNVNIEPKIDVMTILSESYDEITQDLNEDSTMECLFEYLIKGGDFDLFKGPSINDQTLDKIIINNNNNDIGKQTNCPDPLELQLNEIKEKFRCIKNDFGILFSDHSNYKSKIIFETKEVKEIYELRSYLRQYFRRYQKVLSAYAENIISKLIALNSENNLSIFNTLVFIIEFCDFIIPKKNNLSLFSKSKKLLYKTEQEIWKLKIALNVIDIPKLIDLMQRQFKKVNVKDIEIYNDLGRLKYNFNKFCKTKADIVYFLRILCQKIANIIN